MLARYSIGASISKDASIGMLSCTAFVAVTLEALPRSYQVRKAAERRLRAA